MDYYPAKNPSTHKTAIIICPGGAYTMLAWDKEGVLPAIYGYYHFSKSKSGINQSARKAQ